MTDTIQLDINPVICAMVDVQRRTEADFVRIDLKPSMPVEISCTKTVDGKVHVNSKYMNDAPMNSTDPRMFTVEDLIRQLNNVTGVSHPLRPVYQSEFSPVFSVTAGIMERNHADTLSLEYNVVKDLVELGIQSKVGKKTRIGECKFTGIKPIVSDLRHTFDQFKSDVEFSKSRDTMMKSEEVEQSG